MPGRVRFVQTRLAASLAVALGLWMGAASHAQALHFRGVATTLPFTPLHSYASGEVGEDLIFFGGISGQGRHTLAQGGGIVAFPMSVFNENIYVLDQSTGTLYTGGTGHLSTTLRNRLRISNAGEVQYGNTLSIYGGYGPESLSTWYTKASVLQIDLAAVRTAVRAGTPVPASAFTILPCPQAQVAGTTMVKLGANSFALLGGSNFEGDYGLGEANPQQFTNDYSNTVHVFDRTVSFTTPVSSYFDPYWLHRRDMNAMPVTLTSLVAPGVTRPGFAMVCGVFNGPSPWENPATLGLGDADVTVHDTYIQKMNQYEGPHASFFAAGTGQNRLVALGGLSFQFFFAGDFYYDFLVPWVADVSEQTFVNGAFVDGAEKIIGQMPLPTVDARLFLRPNMPVNESGQVLLDKLPHNEHLLGRIVGGLQAPEPGPEPATYASSSVFDVYVAVGVRGDVNKDGTVNFPDLNTILTQYGQHGALFTLSGDLNLDGAVDFADLNILLTNFGRNTPG